jgi:hypothetical protein
VDPAIPIPQHPYEKHATFDPAHHVVVIYRSLESASGRAQYQRALFVEVMRGASTGHQKPTCDQRTSE